jgi:hypothetical protein
MGRIIYISSLHWIIVNVLYLLPQHVFRRNHLGMAALLPDLVTLPGLMGEPSCC